MLVNKRLSKFNVDVHTVEYCEHNITASVSFSCSSYSTSDFVNFAAT